MERAALIGMMVITAACADRGPKLEAPVVTTLPNGAVEVRNAGPSGWADTNGWKLVELYRVGGAGAEGGEELVDPMSVALDATGDVYVADQEPAVVKQFGPDGRFVRRFGHEGGGPGEFRAGFVAVSGGALVLHDPQQTRTSVFDTAGSFVRSWASSCCYWSSIEVDRDGIIYIPTGGGSARRDSLPLRRFLRYRLDGTFVDTMRIQNPGKEEPEWVLTGGSGNSKMMMSTSVPLAAGTTWALDPGGGALAAWTADYRFIASRTGLDTAQVVSLARAPGAVSDERRQQIRDSMVTRFAKQFGQEAVEDAFPMSDIPRTAPAFESIEVDRRRNRWVRPDDGGHPAAGRFDVFDSTGAYLGAVPVPAPFGRSWQTVWGMDRVATATEDADGMPVVVVYRIDRQGMYD